MSQLTPEEYRAQSHEALQRLISATNSWYEFINNDENTAVVTPTGELPSLRNIICQMLNAGEDNLVTFMEDFDGAIDMLNDAFTPP